MVIAKPFDGPRGRAFDLLNELGHWVGWVGGDEEHLTLMSTGAPLTDDERGELAARAATAIAELTGYCVTVQS